MTSEIIEAIGVYIVAPICVTAILVALFLS